MKKSGLLGACSIGTLLAFGQAAVAQTQAQVPAPAQAQTSTDPQADSPAPVASPDNNVPVPANSDAAEDARVRENVEQAATPAPDLERDVRQRRNPVIRKAEGNDDILVTGSRLRDGDKTSRLIVIDAKDIRDRGVTSVEELVRTLPQNVATIGAITNSRGRGPLNSNGGVTGQNIVSDVGALGLAAANLGGVGAGNTLVLVNGRRIAGAAGVEQGYVNLNGIPLTAIERVEISTGGQAAIYGADAMGGVINFILKKNYVGTTLTASHRETSSGARDTRISAYTGRAWGSGSIAATLEWGRIDPVVNAKTGYVTNNYAPFFNNNPTYDRRTFSAGTQPGTAVVPGFFDPATNQFVPDSGLTVRPGFVGAPTRADLIPTTLSSSRDYVAEFGGPRTRTLSGTLNFEQKLTDRLSIFATGLYTRSKNAQANAIFGGLPVNLAPGQFYNPFPAFTFGSFAYASTVNYFPGSEIADGSLVPADVENTSSSWTINGGLSYDFGRRAKLQLIYTRSRTTTEGSGTQLGNLVSFQRTVTNGVVSYPCYNFQLANNRIPANQRAEYQAAFDRQCAALTSSDPNVAFNPWRSNAAGGGANIDTFLFPYVVDDLGSSLSNVEGRLTGELLDLPGGAITYAAGSEYSRTGLRNVAISNIAGPDPSTTRYAFFGEVNLPILGRDYTLPFARRLLFNLAARHDVSSTLGAIGTVNRVPVSEGGEIIYGKNTFARTTPSWGVLWSPTNTIDVRVKLTRGFKAPPPTQLFSVQGTTTFQTQIANDPLFTCSPTTDRTCRVSGTNRTYTVPASLAPNPDLRPETSRQQIYSISWQPTGPLAGLNLAVTYNRNRIRNQFATSRELFFFLPAAEVLKLPLFYPRDPVTNKVVRFNNVRYNILGSDYESLTYEASYLFATGIGTFQPRLTYVDNIRARSIGLDDSQVIDQRGRILGVDKYKIVGSVQWNWDKLSTNVFVYHTPSYLNDYLSIYAGGVQLNPDLITRVAPLTTVDLSMSWIVSNGLTLQFAGRNILKARAPFTVVDTLPYDTARYDVQGRSLMFSTRFSF
ncbi:TonB-dependent receptor domain-containing protein [Sphingomonas adhaesiva]|uniref:TonB-dependent receptor domain-containing protein n=1 Tax=Sphingomonas adhaesiva TaxID=28212 RepID=UPI002FF5A8C8